MRDRFGRSTSGVQSRTYGDTEIQSTVDSLSQANLSERESASDLAGLARGPFTGPADVDANNVFDKAFTDYKTPAEESLETASQRHVSVPEGTAESIHSLSPLPGDHVSHQKREMRTDPSGRVSLKRTFTDGSSAGLQSKLMETLAQPYTATDALSSVSSSTLGLGFPVPALHTHSSKWNRVSQAVFRTESQAPWTILAANDLSCLVFGVTQAELRKLSILEVVQNDRRQWLESKLRDPSTDATSSPPSTRTSQANPKSMRFGSGVTAQLFRKPSARDRPVRRSRTDDGYGSSTRNSRETNHPTTKSRGVLLCGDVVPIRKRNGTQGSASIWVMEKSGGLIWVLEEITENIAYIDCDPSWNITNTQGETEKIWGPDVAKSGRRITELLPRLPQECLEIPPSQATAKLSEMKYFAARNSAGFCSPVTVAKADDSAHRLQISSFPHVAGMMVVSSSTLRVISSNSVFSAALFGQERPEGLHITDLLPGFDRLLDVLSEEDDGPLMDGMVIPEQSFRRAKTLSVLREGKDNVASVFLEPAGLTAKHRDGSTMAADVQLRVVKSGTMFSKDEEKKVDSHDGNDDDDSDAESDDTIAATELLYALWVTYSRQVHSNGPAANLPSSHSDTREQSQDTTPTAASGPGIPPTKTDSQQPESSLAEQTTVETRLPPSTLSQQLSEAASQPLTDKPVQPMPEMKSNGSGAQEVPAKRTISDYAILEEMGQGAYGEVKLVRLKKNPSKKVVLKYVTKKRILVDTWTRDRRLGTVPLEIHVLDYLRRDGLKHPNIVEMEGFFEDDVNYYIEMKPHGLPGMDLFDYIELKANMDESECRDIFRQVVDAIHHLHIKARVVHRDIKDENVILDGEGKIKLIDFGSAAYIKNGPFDVFVGTIGEFSVQFLSFCFKFKANAVTDYAAPEVLQGKSYGGKEQDVWALGILLYTIVYKENPFYNIDEILDHPLRVPYLPFSEDCIDLIRKMLDRDVDSRYTITEVMEHPWMVNG